jgi:secreted Zn-dependent insulinase-like peptidase
MLKVQSSNKDADYLEHRINNFLHERRDWCPTEEELKKASESMINELL